MNTKQHLEEQFNTHKGEMVIAMERVFRLIGISEDAEDYYYVLYDGRTCRQLSAAVSFIPLKGYLRDEDYSSLVRIAKLNDCDQPGVYGGPPERTTEQLQHMEEAIQNITFINGPYWDIN